MAALPPGNPEGEKRGPGAVKRSTKLCSGESQSEKHDEARDHPRVCGENGGSAMRRKRAKKRSVLAGYQPQHTRSAQSQKRMSSIPTDTICSL